MQFENITTPEELKSHLNAPYVNMVSNNMYHYTSLETLYKIFKNKTIRFSRLKIMNDVIESNFASDCLDYFFCLSKEPYGTECFGMWAMYGNLKENNKPLVADKIGVKIQFPKTVIENLRNEDALSFHSVTYLNQISRNLYLGTMTNNNTVQIQKEILSGYVKDVCWKYENEYRLRRKFDSSCTGDFLDIPISESLLKELIIYPSPVYTVESCKRLFSELGEKSGFTSVRPVFKKNIYEGKYRIREKE